MPLIKKIQLVIFTYLIFATSFVFAQREELPFTHVEPPNWYVGLKNSVVQVLFHSDKVNLADYKKVSLKYKGVTLKEVRTVENPHYLFLTLDISPSAKTGAIPITFASGENTITYSYPIHPRSSEKNRIRGFNSADVLYLIMPDRFANGDAKNDVVAGMLEGSDRSKPEARHGGDLKGITDHLDYINDLGVTAIWLNPVLENDQKKSSYHGYAITDLYQVDERFGGNSAYLDFIDQSHRRGLKVIQDMVMNHIGNDHWLMHDMPEKTWINQWPEFTRSNYQSNVISDPYQSAYDARRMNDGWFDTTMPDVNQQNPLFATYLIQNTLWWIEFAGIDGIRMDTHPYPDKNFMSRWAKTVLDEYPAFNIVGEAWINSIPATAYWQKGMMNKDGYQSNLPTVTDFPFCFTVPQALNEPGGWDTGMRKLYTLLSQDFLYPDPNRNLTFLDNHDMSRFFLSVGKDLRKFKMGLAFLLTTRGIPQLYYGTELLMDGDGGYHPNVRLDFPGGWPGDVANAFTREGRTEVQNEAFDYLKALLNWRKREPVIHQGKLTHYIPEENVYVYFRSDERKTIMVLINGSPTDKNVVTQNFAADLKGKISAVNVVTGEVVKDLKQIQVPAQTAVIFELK